MTLTVTDDTSIMFCGNTVSENGGTWTALGSGVGGIVSCCDIKRVGTASVAAKADAGMCGPLRGGLQITRGCTIDFCDSCTRRGIITIWMNTTQTLTETACTGGVTVRVGSDACNYGCWQIATCDGIPASCIPSYPGGWQRFTLDLEVTPNSTTGSPNYAAIDYFALQIDHEIDVGGNIKTFFIDQIRFLTAAEVISACPAMATITGTVITTGCLFQEIFTSTQSMCTSGIVTKQGGALNLNYSLDIGGAAAVGTFTSTCELITVGVSARSEAGNLFLRFKGNACNVQTHRFGTETGCAPCSIGSGGGLIKAVNGNNFLIDASCADLDIVEFLGSTIDGASGILWTRTVDKMVSTTVTNSGKIDLDNNAEIRDGVITCSTAPSGTGALEFLQTAGPTCPDFRDMLLQNNTHAMEWSINGANSLCLRNITFASNTADLRFNHSCGLLTVGVLECGDTPSTSDGAAGGTIVVNNNVCVTVTVKDSSGTGVSGAKVGIFDAPVCIGESALFCGTTNACGIFTTTHNFMCVIGVETRVRLIGFIPNNTTGCLTMCGLCVPVTFISDPNVNLP